MNVFVIAALDDLAAKALLRGDSGAAARIGRIRDLVEVEAAYVDNLTRGLSVVRRRVVPKGAAFGWLLRYCPMTRANRRVLGVWVPAIDDFPEPVTITDLLRADARGWEPAV